MDIGFVILAALLVVCLLWAIRTGNRFRRLAVKISESESGIDVALARRHDTLVKLLDVCRQYAGHEADTLGGLVELRQGMTMAQRGEAAREMGRMAERLTLTAEAYPQLRSAEVFRELQEGVRDAEAHMQASRRLYNANVSSLNQLLVTFPPSLIGRLMKLRPAEFFEADEASRADVRMAL